MCRARCRIGQGKHPQQRRNLFPPFFKHRMSQRYHIHGFPHTIQDLCAAVYRIHLWVEYIFETKGKASEILEEVGAPQKGHAGILSATYTCNMADMNTNLAPAGRAGPKYKDLSDAQSLKVLHMLQRRSQNWSLYHGAIAKVAAEVEFEFGV